MTEALEAWEAARCAWPRVTVEPDVFARYVAARGVDSDALAVRAADFYIVCACLQGVSGAAEAFTARYLADVRRYVGSLARGRSDDFFREVGQRLAEKLLVGDGERGPRLAEYTGRGALEGWVRMAAMRCALDVVRREQPSRDRQEDLFDHAVGKVDGELAFIKEHYRPQFIAAFRAALQSLSPQSRALLRLHYLEQVTTAALAALHNVSRPTIVRRLTDVREEVLTALAEHVRAHLKVEGSEYESLLALVRSQIDVSLTGILRSWR